MTIHVLQFEYKLLDEVTQVQLQNILKIVFFNWRAEIKCNLIQVNTICKKKKYIYKHAKRCTMYLINAGKKKSVSCDHSLGGCDNTEFSIISETVIVCEDLFSFNKKFITLPLVFNYYCLHFSFALVHSVCMCWCVCVCMYLTPSSCRWLIIRVIKYIHIISRWVESFTPLVWLF